MMKPEIKAKWVAALRSGKYTQGRQMLRNSIGYLNVKPESCTFCCLGVLTDLYAKEMGISFNTAVEREDLDSDNTVGYDTDFPQLNVLEWAGMDSNDPIVRLNEYDSVESLSYLNDSRQLAFVEIAQLIEEQL